MVKGRLQNPSPVGLQIIYKSELAEQEPEHDLLKPDPRLKVSDRSILMPAMCGFEFDHSMLNLS